MNSDDQKRILEAADRSEIAQIIYRPKDDGESLPVMVYLHGAGYITGNPEQTGFFIEKYIQTRPCVVIAPAYRTSYVKPYPAGFDDCYDTLVWVQLNAEKIGANADKIIVAGHSGGGGLTAAVTLKARDTGDVKIAACLS